MRETCIGEMWSLSCEDLYLALPESLLEQDAKSPPASSNTNPLPILPSKSITAPQHLYDRVADPMLCRRLLEGRRSTVTRNAAVPSHLAEARFGPPAQVRNARFPGDV